MTMPIVLTGIEWSDGSVIATLVRLVEEHANVILVAGESVNREREDYVRSRILEDASHLLHARPLQGEPAGGIPDPSMS